MFIVLQTVVVKLVVSNSKVQTTTFTFYCGHIHSEVSILPHIKCYVTGMHGFVVVERR